jgi:uncharacterized protein (DUF1800 family)
LPNADPEPGKPFLQRTATRRTLLAGAATAAAAGTAAAIVGLAANSQGGSQRSATESPTAASPGVTPTPNAAERAAELAKEIPDAKVRAAHLFRRAGFGGTPAQIEEFASLSREEAANRLLNLEAADNAALNARIAGANFNLTTFGGGPDGTRPPLFRDMQRWWLYRMSYTARPLEERMTFIWHGLLTTQQSSIGGPRSKLIIRQNELFRANALGQYDALLKAIGKDPAMMVYLNTVDSTAQHPNENYARELMELFSMGEGNYTETDVREGARAFTGWRFSLPEKRDPPAGLTDAARNEFINQAYANYDATFEVVQRAHDAGPKTFLGETGNWDGDDIARIIMKQPATGRFITKRLFSEFAYRNPDKATIDRLVETWVRSNHDVKEVVRAILVSDEFYSMRAYRALIRCPIDFVVGAVRGLEIETDFLTYQQASQTLDQRLYEPPNVAGWPGGELWLSSGSFFGRVNFLDAFLFPRGRPLAIPSLAKLPTAEATVDEAVRRLLNDDISSESRQSLYTYARTVNDPQERAAAVAYLVLASPEYQLV